jgi:ketopantoate reductase
MRFAIFGTGGLGGYYGARLAQAGCVIVAVKRRPATRSRSSPAARSSRPCAATG